jgi:hypothetical protein
MRLHGLTATPILNKLGMKFDPLMAERVIENVRTMDLDANDMEF